MLSFCFNYEVHVHNALTYKFDNFASDVSAIGEHLSVFWLNLYCACTETVISELSVKILAPLLDPATPISTTVSGYR